MPSHKQLSHALALSKCGNFTQAAFESHLSQSAFSRSISNLEKELEVVLFDRDGNSVIPTVYGEKLLSRAAAIVSNAEELERDFKLLKGLSVGSLSIALGVYPAELSGNKAIGLMAKAYPDITYKVSVGNWEQTLDLVLTKKADLGYVAISSVENDDRFENSLVSQHEMVLYARKEHPLAGGSRLSNDDLKDFPLVSIRVPGLLAQLVPGKSQIDKNAGALVPSIEVDDLGSARTIVANSNGIGVAVPIQIERELLLGELVILNYKKPWLNPSLGFIFLKNRSKSPASEKYIQYVLEIEEKLSSKNTNILKKFRP